MNQKVSRPAAASQDVHLLRRPPPARSYTVILLGLLVFTAAVTILVFHMRSQIPEQTAPRRTRSAWLKKSPPREPGPVAAPLDKTPDAPSSALVPRRQLAPTASQAPASLPLPASALPAQQIITQLSTLDPSQGGQLKQTFQNLLTQGQAAVPAIREFLEKNQDLSFSAAGTALGYSSLRAGLFDILAQIGGPEAQALLMQTLRSTADPSEIAALARILEQQAPGQYRQDALNAARETLDQIANGRSNADPAPLFQLFKNYGDSGIAADLAARAGQWPYYSVMALASLPDGQGISLLAQQLNNPDPAFAEARTFALRMLAQLAAQNPAAASSLAEYARANQISDRNWRQVVAGLAGDQYQFGTDSAAASATPATPGYKTYHIEKGNQNFYSLPIVPDALVAQRIAIIDQLLATTSNSAAVQQLQQARATLVALK